MIDPLLDETEKAFAALNAGPLGSGSVESLRNQVSRFKGDMLKHLDNEEPIFFRFSLSTCQTKNQKGLLR